MQSTALQRNVIAAARRKYSLAAGAPDESLLPYEPLEAISRNVLTRGTGTLTFRHAMDEYVQALIPHLAALGIPDATDRVIATAGAQQAIFLVTAALAVYGVREIRRDRHAYPGIEQAAAAHGLQTVPAADMLGADDFHGEAPIAAYLLPDGHNPRGVTMDPTVRAAMAAAARETGTWILEDATYAPLSLDGSPRTPIAALLPEQTFYIGTLSKSVAPALRVGWIVAPRQHVATLRAIKDACDLDCASLAQAIAARFLASDGYLRHLEHVRQRLRGRREAMLAALSEHVGPSGATWMVPATGVLLWLRLPAPIDAGEFERLAQTKNVGIVPDIAFLPATLRTKQYAALRLSFAATQERDIREAIARLADLM